MYFSKNSMPSFVSSRGICPACPPEVKQTREAGTIRPTNKMAAESRISGVGGSLEYEAHVWVHNVNYGAHLPRDKAGTRPPTAGAAVLDGDGRTRGLVMASHVGRVVQRLRNLLEGEAPLRDAELLGRFIASRD